MKQTFLFLFLLLIVGCKSSKYADLGDGLFADIQTSKGDIVVKLEYQKTPVTVANFVSLAEGTNPFVSPEYKEKRFYDGLTFHRVMKDFMIQGGDPLGSGMGNPGYRFKDEFVDSLKHTKKGILSMANSGALKTNGSQFFITHKATPWLNAYDENGFLRSCGNPRVGCHTVFGEVITGLAVVDSIANVEVGDGNKPTEPVVMNAVEIVRNGKAAKKFDAVQIMTDYFAEEEAKEAAFAKMKTEFAATLAQQKETAETLPSGLKVLTLAEGAGEKPKIGQRVKVNHAGFLMDGTLFDTSFEEVAKKHNVFDEGRKAQGRYEPWPTTYSPEERLIAGFKEGMLRMRVGDKVRLFIPSHLGYGPQGSGPIPPNADLVFDLELVEIQK